MAETKRQNPQLPDEEVEKEKQNQICLPMISSGRLAEWQKPEVEVKSLYNNNNNNKPSDDDAGSLIRALSKMRQAKREGRPVTDTVIIHNGEQVDLGPILLKMERRRESEPKPEPEEGSGKRSLESMTLQFEKAKKERREKGCEDVQQDKQEALVLEYEKMKRQQPVSVIVPPEKRQYVQGKCIKGVPLHPYCTCSPLTCSGDNKLIPTPPIDQYNHHYGPIWLHYHRQIRQTHCFDIDVHPGSSLGAGVSVYDFDEDDELMMELANRAIQEYNERECDVFKYKVLKIEKVNFAVTDYFEYWMTVKVLNLTLGTPIETFQIHAGKSCLDGDVKFIYCCQPKEEAVVGLANCNLCLRKLR